MKLPEIITGRLQVLKVGILPGGKWEAFFYVLRRGRYVCLPEEEAGKGGIVWVWIGGAGVLQKVYREGDEETERITGNTDLFWIRETRGKETVLTFMRKDQVQQILNVLERRGIQVYEVYLSGGEGTDGPLPASGEIPCWLQTRGGKIGFGNLFRTDRKGRMLAACLFRRLRLPLLGFWLAVLSANYFGRAVLEKKIRLQDAVLAVKVRETEGRNREDEKIRALSGKMESWSLDRCVFWLDRIARHVPREMQLSLLAVAPYGGKLRAGKEPEIVPGIIVIEGECPDSGAVTRFCRLLEQELFCRTIELNAVDRIPGQKRYRFEIRLCYNEKAGS